MPVKREHNRTHSEETQELEEARARLAKLEELRAIKTRITQLELQLKGGMSNEANDEPSSDCIVVIEDEPCAANSQNNDTVENMLAKLDRRKPGAHNHIRSIYNAHERAMGNGEWHWDTCYTLHHTCVKQRINPGQMERHQKSGACGACLKDGASHCTSYEDGDDECRRCTLRGKLCLSTDDLKPIYKKLAADCAFHNETDTWALIRMFFEDSKEIKLKYLKRVVDDFIESRTTLESHAGSSRPCRLNAHKGTKKVAARGSFVVFCTEPMSHRKLLSHVSYLRLRLLIDAIERGDDARRESILLGHGQISHRCRPRNGHYCWEWQHVSWESHDANVIRDERCFPAKELCRCRPHCLENGYGTRFVRNINPVDPAFGHWRPAAGGRIMYKTSERPAIEV